MNPADKLLSRKLYLAVTMMVLMLLAGVAGFMIIEHLGFTEAMYMTVIVVSTVGLSSGIDLSPDGRMFVAVLIILSLAIATYALTVISTAIMEGDLQKLLKNRKVKRKIDHLNNHIIICGYGRNGKEAYRQLTLHEQPCVAVDTREEPHPGSEIYFVQGDATRDEILQEAGIDRASGLITTLPDDADNVFVVLTARGLNPRLKIISRASDDASFTKLKRAGADNVIMPDKIGGMHMAALVAQPDVLEFLEVITGRAGFDLEEVAFDHLKPECQGKTVGELAEMAGPSVNVIGIKTQDGNYQVNPEPQTTLSDGMKLFVLGMKRDVDVMKNRMCG